MCIRDSPYGNANIDEGIGYLKSALSDAQTEVNNLSADFDKSSAEVEQYKEAVKGVADVTSALVPEQLANGEYSQALSGIKTALGDVKSYTQEMGFDKFASDITEQLTVAQQGFKNIAQVAKSGDNGISNFFSDFASNAEMCIRDRMKKADCRICGIWLAILRFCALWKRTETIWIKK